MLKNYTTYIVLLILAVLCLQVSCANQRSSSRPLLSSKNSFSWAMLGPGDNGYGSLLICEIDQSRIDCQQFILPIRGTRQGCEFANGKIYATTCPKTPGTSTILSIAEFDPVARVSIAARHDIVIDKRCNVRRFAIVGDHMFLASENGLIDLDIASGMYSVVFGEALNRAFGVVSFNEKLLVCLSDGTLIFWTRENGAQTTTLRVDTTTEAIRIQNDVLVCLDYQKYGNKLVFLALKEEDISFAASLTDNAEKYPIVWDAWIIGKDPHIVGVIKMPLRFFLDPPGVGNRYWAPDGTSYWPFGVLLNDITK